MTVDERFDAASKKVTADMTPDEQINAVVGTLCHQDIDDFDVWMQSKDQNLDRFVFLLSSGRKARCGIVRLKDNDPVHIFADIQEIGDGEEINTAMGRYKVLSGPVAEDEVVEICKRLTDLFGIVFQISWGDSAECAGKLISTGVRLQAPRFPPGTKIKRRSASQTIFAVVEAHQYEGLLAGIGAWYNARHLKKNGTPGKRTESLGSEWEQCVESYPR
jgi:hypothetical protein